VEKFKECCASLPPSSFVIDDASYFILKNYIKYPVAITYSGFFESNEKIYKDKKITYLIVRCGLEKGVDTAVDGGLGEANICFIPVNYSTGNFDVKK
jgi:hypothetical protein